MIESFKHKGLGQLFEDDKSKRTQPAACKKNQTNLGLDASSRKDKRSRLCNVPTHPLKGMLAGFWSVTVRANWRIIFRFEGGKAFDVDLVDYH
jgi:toxin HigB-1